MLPRELVYHIIAIFSGRGTLVQSLGEEHRCEMVEEGRKSDFTESPRLVCAGIARRQAMGGVGRYQEETFR